MTRTTSYQVNGGGLQGAALNNLKNSWYKVSGSFRVKPAARESTSSLMIRSSFSGLSVFFNQVLPIFCVAIPLAL